MLKNIYEMISLSIADRE